MRGYFIKKRKHIKELPAGGIILFCLAISAVPVQAADRPPSAHITVDDIYHGTLKKDSDGTLSFRYTNKKGSSLPAVIDKKSASVSDSSRKISLPPAYDLRTDNAVTSIKDQGYSGSCWAFASLKSLESNLIKAKKATPALDLSENHLSWYLFHPSQTATDPMYLDGISFQEDAARTSYQKESSTIKNSYSFSSYYHTLPYIKGSNALLGTFVLARWSGAVLEAAAPFHADSTKNLFAMAETMKNKADTMRYQADYYLTDSNCYDGAPLDEIKTALMNTGALEASIYHDNNELTENSDGSFCYYQKSKGTADANHSITIIGWDDQYSRQNFGNRQPEHDGAWLIANSYGSGYGQNGYFWLSYEEPSLGEIYGFAGTDRSAYDNNYQYDGSGWGSALLPKKEFPIKVANIFTAHRKYTQSLEAVALYTVTPDQPYTVYIYKNVPEGNPTGGTLAATLTGTEKYSGYHTLRLPESISLKANEKFSVVVSYHKTTENNGYIPIEGVPLYSSSLTMNFHSAPGKSFCYAYAASKENGETSYRWTDLNKTPISASGEGDEKIYNNVCIKAFTKNRKSAGTLRFPSSTYTLGKGEKITLSPSVKNYPAKNIVYSSSKSSVAKVINKCQIKAKKKGTALITATLPTGAYAAVTLKVKAAPKKIRFTGGNKTIRMNKSMQLKIKLPAGSASHKITYKSSSPKIAKVNKNGRVTGKSPGTAIITAKTYNLKKTTIKITIK